MSNSDMPKALAQHPLVHDDDEPRGLLLSRKEALLLMAGAGTAMFSGAAPARAAEAEIPPICVARPEMTAGPFYVDTGLERSDIRAGVGDGEMKPGILLELFFNVSRLRDGACTPLPGAVVDVWHCDAAGVYSGVEDRRGSSVGQTFFRGYQTTDAEGRVHFTTIYPGWYPGRTVHIHFTIRSAAGTEGHHNFTSQVFFDDALTDKVHGMAPYAAAGQRDKRNTDDGIFRKGGDQLLLDVAEKDGVYTAAFDIAVLA